jgi:hypothetical protein
LLDFFKTMIDILERHVICYTVCMTILIKKCPKCSYTRRSGETDAPERCPACGLYFEKWATRQDRAQAIRAHHEIERNRSMPSWCAALHERLVDIPAQTPGEIYVRAVMLALFCLWGFRLAHMDFRDGEMSTSFMHAILLPIHEAGHVIFMPFGEFMMILGGSLFQLLIPLVVATCLLWQNRDAFGAVLGLWWCSASLMDLAAYIYDAKQPQLILLGGHTGEDGGHDWIYLLGVFGKIEQSQTYGWLVHRFGILLMLAAIGAGILVLWRTWKAASEKTGK